MIVSHLAPSSLIESIIEAQDWSLKYLKELTKKEKMMRNIKKRGSKLKKNLILKNVKVKGHLCITSVKKNIKNEKKNWGKWERGGGGLQDKREVALSLLIPGCCFN